MSAPKREPTNERTRRLHELMREHELRSTDVADLVGRSSQTVRLWRCESKIIPSHALIALEFAIAERKKMCEELAGVILSLAMVIRKNPAPKDAPIVC